MLDGGERPIPQRPTALHVAGPGPDATRRTTVVSSSWTGDLRMSDPRPSGVRGLAQETLGKRQDPGGRRRLPGQCTVSGISCGKPLSPHAAEYRDIADAVPRHSRPSATLRRGGSEAARASADGGGSARPSDPSRSVKGVKGRAVLSKILRTRCGPNRPFSHVFRRSEA